MHRLDPEPANAPSQGLPFGHWVIDNYGGDFDATTEWTLGAPSGTLDPWVDGLGSLEVVQRDLLGQQSWSAPCAVTPLDGSTALWGSGCGPVAEGQYALVSDVCAFDTTEAGLCPGETLIWGNTVVASAGLHAYVGTSDGTCQTLEVLDLTALDPPPLYWTENSGQLTAPEGWTDYTWTLNGTALETEGAVLDIPGGGQLTLTAVDPVTGCTVGTSGTVGCPGDLDGDNLVGVGDILQLLGSFGCLDACGPADVNFDNTVNVSDVLFLLGLFGSNC